MIYEIKDFLKKFFGSRLFVLSIVMILMFALIIGRVFVLQIVNGASYQKNFTLKIEKTLSIDATRGNIYDCNGNLLAYNELAYSLVISDAGKYKSNKERNYALNSEIAEIATVLRDNNETLYNNFKISFDKETQTYSYNVSGTSLKRFLADVFGAKSYDELEYNDKYGFNEATATADQVMNYLMDDANKFLINKWLDENELSYDEEILYDIVVVRSAMLENRYSQYKTTIVAENINDYTVAYMNEHSDKLIGVSIEEDTIRKYNESVYFASIIGYTGKISTSEYETLSSNDKTYTTNDIVGKSGLEQYYEQYLRGLNGEKDVYVDNLGKISEIINITEPKAGNDLYISIDSELQKATYLLLEQEIAGVVYSNIKAGKIPIMDVYLALIRNNVINTDNFASENASGIEQAIYQNFQGKQVTEINEVSNQLTSSQPATINTMNEETLDLFTYIFTMLKNEEILKSDSIDTSDSTYLAWKNGDLSPKEYLQYCIEKEWVDITLLNIEDKYSDSTEIYKALCDCIIDEISNDTSFNKIIYEYMIRDYSISAKDLCLILYNQGVFEYDENTVNALTNSTILPQDFLMSKIDSIELTPAQLALDPCTGSCVITDTQTGEIKALVSYPGYDNNKLANGVDAEYYAALNADNSKPLWNYATQEKTAPGSTFKMVSATASLAEGVISVYDRIECTGKFMEVDNEPECWIYPGRHGFITVSQALQYSCNVFFYTMGYDLSKKDTGAYNDANGIKYIQKYASLYGLDQKTGIEISESQSTVATEYPVMAAIGQSNNNYTTVALSRYITAVATGNLYSYQLMNKIVDTDGNVIDSYKSENEDISGVLTSEQWGAIREGMRNVVAIDHKNDFAGLETEAAGKTGTAQQVETRPNHALFIGYAPYEDPKISIAVRISYGYSSSNAASASRNILSYYFGEQTLDEILALKASGVNSSTSTAVTD